MQCKLDPKAFSTTSYGVLGDVYSVHVASAGKFPREFVMVRAKDETGNRSLTAARCQ